MSQKQWYLKLGDVVLGPMSGSELKRLAGQGSLTPTTLVSRDGKKWTEASNVRRIVFGPPTVAPAALPASSGSNSAAPHSSSGVGWMIGGVVGVLALSVVGLFVFVMVGAIVSDTPLHPLQTGDLIQPDEEFVPEAPPEGSSSRDSSRTALYTASKQQADEGSSSRDSNRPTRKPRHPIIATLTGGNPDGPRMVCAVP